MSYIIKPAKTGKVRWAMETIDLFILCEEIYKLEKVGEYYYSPLRNDGRYPAFAIKEDGQVCIDHGTGAGFNVLTLIERVERLTRREAVARLVHYAETHAAGGTSQGAQPPSRHTVTPATPPGLVSFDWPFLEVGSHTDYLEFARIRGLCPLTLITATALGLFHFFTDNTSGQRLCTVTDSARHVRQDRSINGEEVALSKGGSAKTRSIGKASWPVGAADIGSKSVVLLAEGMPDLLAALQVILSEGRDDDTATVAMLGAGQLIHPQALPHFAGKRVRIFPDNDEAGARAGVAWQRQLTEVGAVVDCFSMSAPGRTSLGPIKDLNDFVVAGGTIGAESIIPACELKGAAW